MMETWKQMQIILYLLRKANWVGSLTESPGELQHEVYSGSLLSAKT